jgi:hypothetical protein
VILEIRVKQVRWVQLVRPDQLAQQELVKLAQQEQWDQLVNQETAKLDKQGQQE